MELLSPAGNLKKLKWAVIYGADAVYFGTRFGSLRNFAGNFSFDDAQAGLGFLHSNGKKGYVTLNIYPFHDEYKKIIKNSELSSYNLFIYCVIYKSIHCNKKK